MSCTTVFLAAIVLLFAASAVPVQAAAAVPRSCHNVTGTCLEHGFVCANSEVVPHAQRCDGVENCADGTDEFMCHAPAMALESVPEHARAVHAQMSCIKCNCAVNTANVNSGHPWWPFARTLPLTPTFMTTPTGAFQGRPCNPAAVNTISVRFFKKDLICRGWLCCARQNGCVGCNFFTTAQRCYA